MRHGERYVFWSFVMRIWRLVQSSLFELSSIWSCFCETVLLLCSHYYYFDLLIVLFKLYSTCELGMIRDMFCFGLAIAT